MMRRPNTLRVPGLFVLGICLSIGTLLPAQTPPQETPEQYQQRMAWWQQARFGMFIHWGPVSLKGTEIGWSRGGERRGTGGTGEIPVEVYDNLYKQFNPVQFNAQEWVAIAKDAGMKYLVFTTRHHDGFSMFDSALTDYKITNSPFGRDVVRELADACHEAGLRLGFYYSPPDWHHPDYRTENHARYIEYLHGQIRELCTNYGRIDILWFDGLGRHGQGLGQRKALPDDPLAPAAHRHQQPRRPGRRPRHARAGDRQVPEHPPVGNLHHHLQPVGLEARRHDEVAQAVHPDAGPLRRRRRQPAVQRRPDARRPRSSRARSSASAKWAAGCSKYGETIYGTRGGPFKPGQWGASTYQRQPRLSCTSSTGRTRR